MLKILKVVFGGLTLSISYLVSIYCENKNSNLNIWKRGKRLNLTIVYFKIWNFKGRGSPIKDDKKITFESDKKGSLLRGFCG